MSDTREGWGLGVFDKYGEVVGGEDGRGNWNRGEMEGNHHQF